MEKKYFIVLISIILSIKSYSQSCSPLVYNATLHSLSVSPDTMVLNIKTNFCAIGNGSVDDMPAFEAASAFINSRKGFCKLIIPNGTYRVGKQLPTTFTYHRYGVDILRLFNVKNIEVVGGGNTVILYKSGLKYGSFDPVTGEKYEPPTNITNFQEHSYGALIGSCINIFNSRNILVHNLTLDGNFYPDSVNIGGRWGDTGVQLKHTGLNIEDSGNIYASNIISRRFGLDGLYINNHQDSLTQRGVYIDNYKSQYNGRQGCSITGGVSTFVTHSEFNNSGRGIIASQPCAGLDVEPNPGRYAKEVYFSSCKFLNNLRNGIEVVNGTLSNDFQFNDCIVEAMRGSYTINIGVHKKMMFNNCKFYGIAVDRGNGATSSSDGVLFRSCLFSDCYFRLNELTNLYERITLEQSTNPIYYGYNLSFLKFENCIFNIFSSSGTIRLSTASSGGRTIVKNTILNNNVNSTSVLIISKIDFINTTIRNFLCRYDDINNCTFNNVIFQKWDTIGNPVPNCE